MLTVRCLEAKNEEITGIQEHLVSFSSSCLAIERIRLPKVGRCFTIRSRIDDGQGCDNWPSTKGTETMNLKAKTVVARSVVMAGLILTGAGLFVGCGVAELTPTGAANLIAEHPDFKNPANLGVYGGTPEVIEVTSVTPNGADATATFVWMYNRNFQGTKGNVPSTLYYTRMLDSRPREGRAAFSSASGAWAVESMGSLWESIRESTPVAGSTYDDIR